MKDLEPIIVSTNWLSNRKLDQNIVVVDASWYLPSAKRDAKAEYMERHIPGACFFDLEEIPNVNLEPVALAEAEKRFSDLVSKLGINGQQHVVVYDGAGLYSAARLWWLFRFFGKKNVSVLDGGFVKWLSEGKEVTSDLPHLTRKDFFPIIQTSLLADLKRVARAANRLSEQIIDARSQMRFNGLEVEPRAGLRSGNIPSSINVCYTQLLTTRQTLKDPNEIVRIFQGAGVNLNKPIITSCGSGVTAAILYLALRLVGCEKLALYDGSWSEWGSIPEIELEKLLWS